MSHVSAGTTSVMFLISGFAATHAEAAVVTLTPATTTQTFNITGAGTPTDIFIGDSTNAQFSLSSETFTALNNSQIGAKNAGQIPAADASFSTGTRDLFGVSDLQIKFDIAGVSNVGLARFDGSILGPARLTTVEFRPAAVNGAVPEPDTWALMIAGFGAVGTAMRVARRRRPQAMAA